MAEQPDFEESIKKFGKTIAVAAVVIVLAVVLFKSSVTVGAGEAGVLFKTFSGGVDTENTYGEGWHIIAPWNKLVTYKVRQQELKEKSSGLTSDGLKLDMDVSIFFQPISNKLPLLYQQKGENYIDDVVKPVLRSATRSVIGRYTPEEIYSTKREQIQSEIKEETRKKLESQFVQLNDALVRDVQLPNKIKEAIERKLEEEQLSLEYEFRLDKEKKEAQRIKIAAEGKAEANRILNASLTPNILKEKGIEATLKLAESKNAKIVVVGNSEGLPLILNN